MRAKSSNFRGLNVTKYKICSRLKNHKKLTNESLGNSNLLAFNVSKIQDAQICNFSESNRSN